MKRALVSVCALLALGACSSAAPETLGAPGNPDDVTETVDLTAREFEFSESEFEFSVGDTIEFVVSNEGQAQHEFAIGALHEHDEHSGHSSSESTGAIDPGNEGTLVWTFDKAGETAFACYIAGHNEQGMTGTITVTE